MSNFYTEPFVSAGEMEFPSEPYITAQPQNHTATGPEEYVLTVIAAGAVSYQWEVFDGESWSTIPGATSDTLTISIDSSMNGWRYRVLVTGADGSTVTSKAAQIAVKGVHEITLEGAIVTFTGPARIKSLEVEINAVQDLHGQSNPYPAGGGKNKIVPLTMTGTVMGCTAVCSATTETITLTGTATSSGGRTTPLTPYITLEAGTYTLSVNGTHSGQYIVNRRDNNTYISAGTFTLSEQTEIYVGVNVTNGNTYNETVKLQLESDSTATAWSPYENICPISGWSAVNVYVSPTTDAEDGTTYPISLGQTVYGGVLDVIRGKLYTCPYYASYNGETLTGHWISDRDAYAEGTTPTIGAQVVNDGGALTEVTLTPTEVSTLTGVNNIWADSGDVRVTIIR